MAFPKANGRHWNFYIAVAAGLVVLVIALLVAPDLSPTIATSVFSIAYLSLTARDIPKLTPDYLREHAADEDAPPWVVFVLTLAIVVYAIVALFVAVNDASPNPLRLVLGISSVVLAWLMIHTIWGMHYAWEYYAAPAPKSDSRQSGGLKFPGDDEPEGIDFVYFSLVVATSAQTSDTDVTDRAMRRIVSVHSLFSYLFNTVIVAAAVNIVVSIGQ